MSIWWALFFMALGGTVVEVFELKVWTRYKQGKREGMDEKSRMGGGRQ